MTKLMKRSVMLFTVIVAVSNTYAQVPKATPEIDFVVMGGNDCPPCVAWRALELPKLKTAAEFNAIRFSYVFKAIRSAVPSSIFFPENLKPYRDKLMTASGGRGGSPQAAILVNGEVYDYYYGTRSSEDILAMLASIQKGTSYPFNRCLKIRANSRDCEINAS